MAVHRLSISDFDAIDYSLLAIHTSLEDYRLAYFLNQRLPILLSKANHFIECRTPKGKAFFSTFSYTNEVTCEEWTLIENKDESSEYISSTPFNLFSEEKEMMATRAYFLPELKKVAYFLKITNVNVSLQEIINQIKTISKISTAYLVDVKNLKSKNNLIF